MHEIEEVILLFPLRLFDIILLLKKLLFLGLSVMPIYEYQCSQCHHSFDLIQKVNDEPVNICPECGKDSEVRLVSAPGFQLKGTGWYATDFKHKGQAPAPSTESNAGGEKKVATTSAPKGESD